MWLLLLVVVMVAQQGATVEGVVQDQDGKLLSYVNVFFTDGVSEGSLGEGAMTDEAGKFRLETPKFGVRILRISHIGYVQKDMLVDVQPERSINLTIELEEALVEMDAVTISAGTFTMADEEGQTLTSLDVVTTAGAAADIFAPSRRFRA